MFLGFSVSLLGPSAGDRLCPAHCAFVSLGKRLKRIYLGRPRISVGWTEAKLDALRASARDPAATVQGQALQLHRCPRERGMSSAHLRTAPASGTVPPRAWNVSTRPETTTPVMTLAGLSHPCRAGQTDGPLSRKMHPSLGGPQPIPRKSATVWMCTQLSVCGFRSSPS